MEVYVKRENWDGGIWMELPASDEREKQVVEELEAIAPPPMIPFIGDVKSPVKGLSPLLIGEFVFQNGNLGHLNYLAAMLNAWTVGERAVFEAALQMEQPNSLLRIMEVMDHLGQYNIQSEIKNLEQLGRFLLNREQRKLPPEIAEYFDYERYGRMKIGRNMRLTDEGLVTRIEAQEIRAEKKDLDVIQLGEAVFRAYLSFDAEGTKRKCFQLPMLERELKVLEEMCDRNGIQPVPDYHSNIWDLGSFLPPGLTLRELNQVANEIQNRCTSTAVSRKKLLASLEAEVPRTVEMVCRVIDSYGDYEFLPLDELSYENYGRYLYEQSHVNLEEYLEQYISFGELGLRKMKETRPVQTSFGVLINRAYAIPEMDHCTHEFRLYNSLAVTAYWNKRESSLPQLLSGEELLSYQNIIRQKIKSSLEPCSENGLAEYLSNVLLKKQVAAMIPDVEEHYGSLLGVLTVRTYGKLNDREMEALIEEWRVMVSGGWGEELFYRPIRTQEGEIYIGFWDTDNNDSLFIKTEEEFRKDCQGGGTLNQEPLL